MAPIYSVIKGHDEFLRKVPKTREMSSQGLAVLGVCCAGQGRESILPRGISPVSMNGG